jgi:RHH-type rel operon transcriptional repressor/antitoxin RelB
MPTTSLTVRVEADVKKRLEQLARSTGRSRSFLVAEALDAYLDANERHIAGIKRAIASLGRDGGVPHKRVKEWVET